MPNLIVSGKRRYGLTRTVSLQKTLLSAARVSMFSSNDRRQKPDCLIHLLK